MERIFDAMNDDMIFFYDSYYPVTRSCCKFYKISPILQKFRLTKVWLKKIWLIRLAGWPRSMLRKQ